MVHGYIDAGKTEKGVCPFLFFVSFFDNCNV
jgi:hypothetical protein